MQRLTTLTLALAFTLGAASAQAGTAIAPVPATKAHKVEIQHIRNATAKIRYGGKTFLLDPFLAKKGKYPGFEGTFNSQLRNPLVDLPMPVKEIMQGVDAVIVSHTHLDHWDGGDHGFIPKSIPLFVQHEADAKLIRAQGFTDVRILGENTVFEGVQLSKTGGQHGTDEMYAAQPVAAMLGKAMGIVFQAAGHKTMYVAGDTIWRSEVDRTLAKFKPDVVVLNTSAARMIGYTGAIIMDKDDVLRAYRAMPGAIVVATHMDAVNHMTLRRKELREFVKQHGIQDRVRIPADGDILRF